MRLILKARSNLVPVVKTVYRKGVPHQQTVWVRPSKAVPESDLHIDEGDYGVLDIQGREFYTNFNGKKVFIPSEFVIDGFKKYGHEFVVHRTINYHRREVKQAFSVTEVKSGLTVSSNQETTDDAIKDALKVLEFHGKQKTDEQVNRMGDISKQEDSSLAVNAFDIEKPLSEIEAKAAEVYADLIEDSPYMEDEFTVSELVTWMDEWLSSQQIDDFSYEHVNENYYWGDQTLKVAIKQNLDLYDAEQLTLNISALADLIEKDFDDVMLWADQVGWEAEDDILSYEVEDSWGDNIEAKDILLRAYEHDEHPGDVRDEILEERRELHEAWEREQQAEEDSDFSNTKWENVPGYDYDIGEFDELPADVAEKVLSGGSLIGMKYLGGGVNGSYRVQMSEPTSGEKCEGIFKPEEEEARTLRSRWQTGPLAPREVAAYKLDKILGLGLVPPTDFVDVEGHRGSVQYFLQDATEAWNLPGWQAGMSSNVVKNCMLFDFLVMHSDRHRKNFVFDSDYNVHLIDNGFCFPDVQDNYMRSSIAKVSDRDADVPLPVLGKMKSLNVYDVAQQLKDTGLSDKSVDLFTQRWMDVVATGKVTGGRDNDTLMIDTQG